MLGQLHHDPKFGTTLEIIPIFSYHVDVTDGTLLLVLASSALHACWNLAARRTKGRFGVVWLSLAAAALCALPFTLGRWGAAERAALPFMAATAVVNAVYFTTLARAYSLGDLAEVYPVTRGWGVVGTALTAQAVFSERLGALGWAGVGLVCAGLYLVTRRPAHLEKGRAWPWALGAGTCIFVSAVVDKTAVGSADPICYITAMFGGSALLLGPKAWARRAEVAEAARRALPSSLLIGCGSLASYLLVLFAMRGGPLGLIAAARETSVVFGAALGAVFLGERLTAARVLGALAVAAGLACVKLA